MDGGTGLWQGGRRRAPGWRSPTQERTFSPFEFTDIAALIGYVRTIPWAVPEFDATSMRGLLRRLNSAVKRRAES